MQKGCQNCGKAVTGLIHVADDTFDPQNRSCKRKFDGCTHRREIVVKPCMCFDMCFNCSTKLKGCINHRTKITDRLRVFYQ